MYNHLMCFLPAQKIISLQRRVKDPVKHLRRSFFPEIVNGKIPLNIFCQNDPTYTFDWDP